MKKYANIGFVLALLLVVPGGILYLLARKGFKSGHLTM